MIIFHYLIGVVLLTYKVHALNTTTFFDEIPESYVNLSRTVGNNLWTKLLKDCKNPTLKCVESTVYSYFSETLEYPNDLEVASFINFSKNSLNYTKMLSERNDENINEIKDDDTNEEEFEEGRSALENMSLNLYNKTIQFLMTHNMELQLPETFFEGTTLKLSPRSFDGDGALMKMEFIPKNLPSDESQPRILKKIKKFIREKVIWALLALLLVIKLLAAKFLFFMPMIVGVAAAKKLLLKILLFLFPVLHHIFKLCPYVPHGTKYHHHKHLIQHLHHLKGHHHGYHGYEAHGHGHPGAVEVIRPHSAGPPSLHGGSSIHHNIDLEPHHRPSYNPHEQDLPWTAGPSFAHEYITHRHDDEKDENEIQPWGQGHRKKSTTTNSNSRLSATEIENMILKAEKEALLKAQLQKERLRIEDENRRLQEQLKNAMKTQEKLKLQHSAINSRLPNNIKPPSLGVPEPSPYLQTPPSSGSFVAQVAQSSASQISALPQTAANKVLTAYKQQLQNGNLQDQGVRYRAQVKSETMAPVKSTTMSPQKAYEAALQQAATITYDAFYSPILAKIDNILDGLGFNDEGCRERLICSMYKSPVQYSPHSNLLSAELSRDSKELQKPTTTNSAVIRFYRYVQAARDGQDKRDCLRLYSACSINTEK